MSLKFRVQCVIWWFDGVYTKGDKPANNNSAEAEKIFTCLAAAETNEHDHKSHIYLQWKFLHGSSSKTTTHLLHKLLCKCLKHAVVNTPALHCSNVLNDSHEHCKCKTFFLSTCFVVYNVWNCDQKVYGTIDMNINNMFGHL